MANKKFSAIVEVGGAVKDSLRSSIKVLGGALSGVGEAVRKTKSKLDLLNKYDPEAVRKMGKEYRGLKRDAEKLRKEYNSTAKPSRQQTAELKKAEAAADKAGKAYNNNRAKLNELGGALKDAGVSTSNLTKEHRRLSAELDRNKNKYESLNRAMKAGGDIKGQIASVAKVGAGLAAGVGVVGAAVTMTNKVTGEQVALAHSLNMSASSLQAWGGIAKEAGFDIDTVGDLVEEMNNKFGESAGVEEVSAVKDGLDMLGLSFEQIQNLAPEEQFAAIADASKKMSDQQQAVSAVDMIFGGEANKFFGYMRSRKESVDEMLAQQKQLNVLSDEGRAGAAAYNTAFSHMTTVVGSVAAQVSGLIGGALAPLVDEYAPKIANWVRSHQKDLIGVGTAIKDAIPGFLDFGRGVLSVFSAVGSAVSGVASLLGGFDHLAIVIGAAFGAKAAIGIGSFAKNIFTVGRAVAPLISSAFPAIISGIRAIGVAVMSNPVGLAVTAVVGAAMLVWKYWDPICDFFGNLGSMIGNAVSTGFDFIKSIFTNFTPLGIVIKNWEPVKNWVGNLFGWIGDKAEKIFGFVGNAISKVGSFFGFGNDEKEEKPEEKAKVKVGDAVKKVKPVAFARPETITEARPVVDEDQRKNDLIKNGPLVVDTPIIPTVQPSNQSAGQNKKEIHSSNHYEIHVHAAPGQSAEEIADLVMQRLEEAGRDDARLALYDN